MSKQTKNIISAICFLIFIGLLVRGYILTNNKKKEFENLNKKTESYQTNTIERISKPVISLPDDNNILVGVNNNIGTYKIPALKKEGIIKINNELLKTNFIRGIDGKVNPRVDAIVPMTVSSDSLGGSTYILLFYDRGDEVIEKSYARIGNLDIKIGSIEIIPKDASVKDQEYKVSIKYISNNIEKETTIPVVDGHFDPKNTVSK